MSNLIHSRISRIEDASATTAEIQYQITKYATDLMESQNEENDSARERLNEILKATERLNKFVTEMAEITDAERHGFGNFYLYQREKQERIQKQEAKPMAEVLTDAEAI
jgi:hypothetical protein